VKSVPLGDSGVKVSAFCLGTMYFGTRNDKASSYRLLDQYVAAGGSFLDTANIYARWVAGFKGGESESLLGECMQARRNRSQMFVATKVRVPRCGTRVAGRPDNGRVRQESQANGG
jgi:aryl-alcohol dehydrogenase-like predicted oxidoreductase